MSKNAEEKEKKKSVYFIYIKNFVGLVENAVMTTLIRFWGKGALCWSEHTMTWADCKIKDIKSYSYGNCNGYYHYYFPFLFSNCCILVRVAVDKQAILRNQGMKQEYTLIGSPVHH